MQSINRDFRLRLWLPATLLAVLLGLALVRSVQAADPVQPAHSDPAWRAAYWNNTSLSGLPALERTEPAIDHDWGEGSPAANIARDGFSARWTRYVYVAPGVYRFSVTSDDGIRLYVDDRLLIDRWTVRSVRTDTAELSLAGGHHLIRVEYFEQAGMAAARASWSRVGDGGSNGSSRWRGEYYDNRTLSGSPALVRYDDRINFNWGEGSPAPDRVGREKFSVRWTGSLNLAAGRYRFQVKADDGVRLWVNNYPLIDQWRDQPATAYHAEIQLPGGNVPVKLEYYEHAADAVIQLNWALIEATQTNQSNGWRGEYYDNPSLAGTASLVRHDNGINFDWGDRSPASRSIGRDNFSIRWTRTHHFNEGRYRFTVAADDGVRLYIDDRLVIDEWSDGPRRQFTHALHLSKGAHTVRLEYYEHTGNAVARLWWSRLEGQEVGGEEGSSTGSSSTCTSQQPGACVSVTEFPSAP